MTQVQGTNISASGDLPRERHGFYIPHPLTAAVTAPRSDTNWTVILALRKFRLGIHGLTQVKIN